MVIGRSTRFIMIRFLSIILVVIFSLSCNVKNEEKKIVAYINANAIYLESVDSLVIQEIFDQEYKMFQIRRVALDEYVSNQILAEYLNSKSMSLGELENYLLSRQPKDSYIKNIMSENEIENGFQIFRNNGVEFISLESEEGQYLFETKLKNFLIENILDSLKREYEIEILLHPPAHPKLNMSNERIYKHSRGNLVSKKEIVIITDYECFTCKEKHPLFDSLYEEYKNEFKFSYVNFSTYLSSSVLAAEAAAVQGRYWEYSDSLFNLKYVPQKADFLRIASSLNLDIDEFNSDLEDNNIQNKLRRSNKELLDSGLYGTPTLIIDGAIIYDLKSKAEIRKIIDNL